MRRALLWVTAVFAAVVPACRPQPGAALVGVPATPVGLPPLPAPIPAAAAVELGRAIFFDPRVSRGDFMSCAECHQPQHAYADARAVNANAVGGVTRRNAPAVTNMAYVTCINWDGGPRSLEEAIALAMQRQLGMTPEEAALRLQGLAGYRALFERAFSGGASGARVTQALASFLRALTSGDAVVDRDESTWPEDAQRGARVFQVAGCAGCHPQPLYSDQRFHRVDVVAPRPGPAADDGRFEVSQDPAEKGAFRTPSLRDVARTAPYFHDGSVTTLEDAVDRMLAATSPDPLLRPHRLTPQERQDLVAFLRSLTGKPSMEAPASLPQ